MADKKINLLSSQEVPISQPIVQAVTPSSIPSNTIQQRHLKGGYSMIKYGLASERPTSSNEIIFYFATDTFVMSYYDTVSKTWKSGSAFS